MGKRGKLFRRQRREAERVVADLIEGDDIAEGRRKLAITKREQAEERARLEAVLAQPGLSPQAQARFRDALAQVAESEAQVAAAEAAFRDMELGVDPDEALRLHGLDGLT